MKRAAALLASGALLAGCGGETTNQAPPPQQQQQQQQQKVTVPEAVSAPRQKDDPTEAKKRACHRAPICDSIVDFRQRVQEKRRAKVMLGLCIAWSNRRGGMTVTVNPGTVHRKFNLDGLKGEFSYPVFSTESNFGDAPYAQQMNGPASIELSSGKKIEENTDLALEFYRRDGSAETTDRPLSENPVRDQAGNLHFEDRETGEPLILTGLVNLPVTEQNVQISCKALRDHTPLPGTN